LCSGRGTLYAQESGFTNAVAVGDQVLVRQEGAGRGVVEQVLPRRSLLARPDVFYPHLQQVVVANVDQLLIVASWREPIIWYELIDRYLVAAARNRLPVVICVNKIDLAAARAECEAELQPYRDLGIPVLLTSAQTGDGIPDLRARLQGRTTVLAGLSGVGKSSLLAAVQPGLHLRVGLVSARKHEGRHTTTQATLLLLDSHTCVVDTPGIREFGLSGLTRAQLVTYFAEMADAAAHCRYRNCSHLDEPGCAVQAAAARGAIAACRMHSYRLIYASLPATL
jgi:ribosome biogenesis GTPase